MNVYLVYISYELWWQGCLRGINARPGEDMSYGDREREVRHTQGVQLEGFPLAWAGS